MQNARLWPLLYQDENEFIYPHVSGIFDAPSVKIRSLFELKMLLDTINNHLHCLKTFNAPTDSWDTFFMYLLKLNLNDTIKTEWKSLKTERSSQMDSKAFLEKH